ncbi:pilus (MSHA type) biogenesis protein MshL [endosymbiont of unidentified scaly snail isolate Monju]|uniref:pilus (MSHA type) biogenesis protein MshL n=1 Tax=endosymbiont of unidentified scaly snail isolate Monju TaxID=1248727 RepID=UPI00038923DB|nr:pilus (MSHA type) biogenesis protein MshL [endosymbiont of unidentified scaly snail isolate Monju]BAN70136.1 MSHA biogenesis protein MshL [endosymbiont of unidentified scaly snail isolate Monju]
MRRLSITLITLLLAACQTPAPRQQATLPDIRQALKEGETAARSRPPTPPPEITAALIPPLKVELGQPEEQERRFDIQVVDAPAREFFMGLVAGTPWNMVVHPDVGGKISLDLKNVTIGEVMETLRNVYGYEYEQTASGFHVLPMRLQSRIYQINYLNVKRNGNSEMRVSSGQMTQNGGGGDTGDNGGNTETLPSSKVITKSASDFWSELRAGLRTLVGDGEGRSVVVSPQSGIVVVRAMPAEQREVAAYLRSLQSTLQRQVIIEAKIIEVQLDDGYRSGIDWGKLAGLPNNGLLTIGQTGGGSVLDSGSSGISGNPGNLDPAAYTAISGLAAQAFGGVFSAAIKTGSFAAFIELLKSQGQVQVLSSPRVATLNNQKAVIKVGQDDFFVTDVSTTTVTGATTTSTPDVTLTPFFSGIALDVTPQIDTRGGVTLHIHPSVSEVTDQSKTFTIDNKTQTLPLAQSRVRESDSIVYARSGEIVVIGELMQESRRNQRASVPGAGELPLLGSLFGHRREQASKSELVILLRPLVIDGPAAWRQDISATARRIDRLGRAPDGKEVF